MSSAQILVGLDELEQLVRSRRPDAILSAGEVVWTATKITGSLIRNDWRPVWEAARELQALFDDRPMFPSREERETAWRRLNELRDEAGRVSREEFEDVKQMSTFYRGHLMSDLSDVAVDPSVFQPLDAILGSATAEDMKQLSLRLNAIQRQFSEWKDKLISVHKQEIFDRIQEVRAMHQRFWTARNEAWERQKEHREARRTAFVARVQSNIERNRERLAKAESIEERILDNISENHSKLSHARTVEFAARVRSWIENDEGELEGIREHIARVRNWIREDEERLA